MLLMCYQCIPAIMMTTHLLTHVAPVPSEVRETII